MSQCRVSASAAAVWQMDRARARQGAWDFLGGETNAGAGVKIGVIDTGIDPAHPVSRRLTGSA